VAEVVAGGVRGVDIVGEADTLALVPGRAVGVVVVDRDLTGGPGDADREPAAGVQLTEEHVDDRLGTVLGGVPGLDDRVEVPVGDVAGNGPAVEVDADQRLAELGELGDQRVLAGREVDVGGVDALAH
jgi:hypothetical protein